MTNEFFRFIRMQHGYNQKDFAELIGVSKANVTMIECGRRNVSSYVRHKVTQHFEITQELLARFENYRKSNL